MGREVPSHGGQVAACRAKQVVGGPKTLNPEPRVGKKLEIEGLRVCASEPRFES